MYEPQAPRLKHIAAALSPEAWEARVVSAQDHARRFDFTAGRFGTRRGSGLSAHSPVLTATFCLHAAPAGGNQRLRRVSGDQHWHFEAQALETRLQRWSLWES